MHGNTEIKAVHFERTWKKMAHPIFSTVRMFYEVSNKYMLFNYYDIFVPDSNSQNILHVKDLLLGRVQLISKQVIILKDLPNSFIAYDTDSECKTREEFHAWLESRYEYKIYKPAYNIEEKNKNWLGYNTKLLILFLFWIEKTTSNKIQVDLGNFKGKQKRRLKNSLISQVQGEQKGLFVEKGEVIAKNSMELEAKLHEKAR